MQSLLSVPRVWDTSQQAIFNRRTAGQEGENTEKGTLFLCLLRKFFIFFVLISLYGEKAILPNLCKRKNAAISKRLQRFLKSIFNFAGRFICPLFRLLKFLLRLLLQSVCRYRSYHQGERRAAAALYLFRRAYLKGTGLRIYCNGA